MECEGLAVRGLRAAETLAEMKESHFSLARLLILLDDPFLPATKKVLVWERHYVGTAGWWQGEVTELLSPWSAPPRWHKALKDFISKDEKRCGEFLLVATAHQLRALVVWWTKGFFPGKKKKGKNTASGTNFKFLLTGIWHGSPLSCNINTWACRS